MALSEEQRRQRLAAALKENIKRRKHQAHARVSSNQPASEFHMTHNPKMLPIKSAGVLTGTLPFSEGIKVGGLIFLSGQLGTIPGSLVLNNSTAEAEFVQVMENIGAVLMANGLGYGDIVKCTVMLADMADWPAFNAVYLRYFKAPLPARSAFGVNGLALGTRAEVECIVASRD